MQPYVRRKSDSGKSILWQEFLVFSFVPLQDIFYDKPQWRQVIERSQSLLTPPHTPHLMASNLPFPPTHISTHLDVPVYVSVGGLAGTKTTPPTLADPDIEYPFIRFQETAKAAQLVLQFMSSVWKKQKRIKGGTLGGGDHSEKKKKKSPGQASGPPNLWLLFLTP